MIDHNSSGTGRLWLGLTQMILVSTALLLPIILLPTGWDAWRFPKVLLVRASAVALIVIGMLVVIWSSRPREVLRRFFSDRLTQVALLVVTWLGVSTAFSPQPRVSAWATFDVCAGLTLFFASRLVARATGLRYLLFILLIPALVNGVVLTLQHYDVWHPLASSEEIVRANITDALLIRKAALLGNRDDVGMYLSIPFLCAIHLFLGAKTTRRRIMTGVLACVLAIFVVLTTTITAILAACVASWFLLDASLRSRRSGWRVRVALLMLPIAVISGLLVMSDARHRVASYVDLIASGNLQQGTGDRLLSFACAVEMVAAHPLLGVGPGRYGIEQLEAGVKLQSRLPSLFQDHQPYWFDMVHNDFLEILAEAGAPALAGSLLFVFIYVARGWGGFLERELAQALTIDTMCMAALLFPLQIAAVYGTLALATGTVRGLDEHRHGVQERQVPA